ncbi:MAG: hypothetical protein AAFY82_00215 [Pseudomonadota bacterium]
MNTADLNTADLLADFGLAPNNPQLRAEVCARFLCSQPVFAAKKMCPRDPEMGAMLLQALRRTYETEQRECTRWARILRQLTEAAWRGRFIERPTYSASVGV